MRYTTFLPLAATASAFMIPDEATSRSLALEDKHDDASSSWWGSIIPTLDKFRNSFDEVLSAAVESVEVQADKMREYMSQVELDFSLFGGDHHGHHDHKPSDYTIYQAIKISNYTTKLAALVDEYPDLVEALNSTSANLTVFAPIDSAFDKIPKDHPKPSKEDLKRILQYHVVPDYYPAGRVLASHTLPSALTEEALGGRHQRLRVQLSLWGLRVNFFSKVIVANMFFKNGVVHGVDHILVPPPLVDKIVAYLPGQFSTLSLASVKTGVKRTPGQVSKGVVIFAPTNEAWKRLGPAANAFLFNTEKGVKYLKALVLYHLVVNETVYSDAYYGHQDSQEAVVPLERGNGRYHLDVPTLLGPTVSVDIARWYGVIDMRLNAFTTVSVSDIIGKDGVIHAIRSVLIPPRKHNDYYPEGQEISVEELTARLDPYVQASSGGDTNSVGEL